jgi:UDP-N-acetylmuramoyl-tripeptide--D-alanyl-D-alanine ligase
MDWTLAQVASALGVAAPAAVDSARRVAGVSIDSRSVRAGEVFFAICGERHDGHDFVPAALAAGAGAAVVSHSRFAGYADALRGRLIAMEDTLGALQSLARTVRIAWGEQDSARRLVGVTGSVGKTTTKEILAALLGARLRVLKSTGNLNNQYGVPLMLLRLDPTHDAAVIEMGMSRRGEIERLAWIARPEVGVVTRVSAVHLENFASIDEVALAKRELIEGLTGSDRVAVLNADDPQVARLAEGLPVRAVTFGESPAAQFRAEKIRELGLDGTEIEVVTPGGSSRRTTLRLPLVGRHNALNALAGLAAASLWGIRAEEAQPVFNLLRAAAMRGEVLRFAEGFSVLNDCYNSSPAALAALVDLLAATPGYHRRVLVVGEMLELGATAVELHRRAGRHIASQGAADWIFGVRGCAKEILKGANEAGYPVSQTRFFETAEEAAEFLPGFAEPGDLILVKGSRGVHLEMVVEALRAKYHEADTPAVSNRGGSGSRG